MANEISASVVAASASAASYVAATSPPGREAGGAALPDNPGATGARDRVVVDSSAYARLSETKDLAAQAAGSIREAGKVLDKADKLLGEIQQQVQIVKNFPPFPQGNEDRENYIKSLIGLRKEFDALVVPPPIQVYTPVFYPRDAGLTNLDPTSASDEQVQAFGRSAEAAKAKVNDAYAVLQAQAEKINADLPQLPSEDQARSLSLAVGAQVAPSARGMTGGRASLI